MLVISLILVSRNLYLSTSDETMFSLIILGDGKEILVQVFNLMNAQHI